MKIVNPSALLVLILLLTFSTIITSLERVWADSILTTIKVGSTPRDIELNPSNDYIYVANAGSKSVSVIDTSTNKVIKTIDVGEGVPKVEYNPSNEDIYVTNEISNTVSVIDSSTNTVVDTIDVETGPLSIEYNPSNEDIYVGNSASESVSVIYSSTNTVVDTISVGASPRDIKYNPSNGNVYVSNGNSDTVSVIDSSTNTVVDTIDVGDRSFANDYPYTLEYNPSNEQMYVGYLNSKSISSIDSSTNTVVDTISVGSNPYALEYNPSNEQIYVANLESRDVSIIDTSSNTVIDTLDVGINPDAIEYNPSNGDMYVTNLSSNDVSIIDGSTNTVIDTLRVGDHPSSLEYNPSNGEIYVANERSGDVTVIATNPSADRIPFADAGPDQMINSNDVVQLDGRNSSDPQESSLSYIWNQTSGPEVTLSDPASPNPTFIAPETNGQTDLKFELIVTNEEGISSEPDSVTITVNPVSLPIANAGTDQTTKSGETVQLDGSSSSDSSGGTLTYQWTQKSGPEVTLSDSTAEKPTFTAPNTNTEVDLVFELVVTNEKGVVSEPDSVTITVSPSNNPPPPFEGILGSGNNVNIQVQENSGNIAGGQSGLGETYSDSPILQDQSTKQDSNVVS